MSADFAARQTPAEIAVFEQNKAGIQDAINLMVQQYQEMLTEGSRDDALLRTTHVLHCYTEDTGHQLHTYLAMAVRMLAEQKPR